MQNYTALLKTKWENIKVSLWFMPVLLAVVATIMAFGLVAIDRQFQEFIAQNIPWLFNGSPSAARSILSAIASSSITIISIAFSLTIIAVQQASVQFTPRVLRTFTSDRGNQIVLGAYVAIFLYALLVLRTIRDPVDDGATGFVPAIATSFALVGMVACIGLLIYYINHTVTSLQAVTVIHRVHHELIEQIDELYPQPIDESSEQNIDPPTIPTTATTEITAPSAGFISRIDESILKELDIQDASYLVVKPKVGDFVLEGEVIAYLDCSHSLLKDEQRGTIHDAVVLEGQRSITQDPLFLIRQLVDIALKALSPGINDPTTADYCVKYMADGLGRLAGRTMPPKVSVHNGEYLKLYVHTPTWEDFVVGVFKQVQFEAKDTIHVTETIIDMLHRVALQTPSPSRHRALREVMTDQQDILSSLKAPQAEVAQLRVKLDGVRKLLEGKSAGEA